MKDPGTDAVCGMRCGRCQYFGSGCKGCEAEKGAPFWTGFAGVKVCPVYDCCKAMNYEHCGRCKDMPCPKFTEIRDPNKSDEEAARDLELQRAELSRRSRS